MQDKQQDPDITFFMIVTEPSISIADYCVRSYRRLSKSPFTFELIVYGNCLSPETQKIYFAKWGRFDYVRLMDNSAYVTPDYPLPGRTIATPEGIERPLQGSFELGGTIWTRELPKITSPFVATVDSDFEIFSSDFVEEAYQLMLGDSKLAGVSTSYSPDNPRFFNTYWQTTHFLHKRWHTWFCLYRRECLQDPTSHHMYIYHDREGDEGGQTSFKVYDDAGHLQAKLIRDGWHFAVLSPETERSHLHYVAFTKNTSINAHNIRVYHRYMVWMRRGLVPCLGFKGARGRLNRWWGYLIHELYVRRFGGVSQSRQCYPFMGKKGTAAMPRIISQGLSTDPSRRP